MNIMIKRIVVIFPSSISDGAEPVTVKGGES